MMKELDRTFDWGPTTDEYIQLFSNENFVQRIYEMHFPVQENDVVFDLGANCGSFTYSIFNKNPKHVYCVEPSYELVEVLRKNTYNKNVTIINCAISDHDSKLELIPNSNVYVYSDTQKTYNTSTFKSIVESHNIEKIDFLKVDCEGGEYYVFTPENAEFIKNNVKKIAGEFHINLVENSVDNFKIFRDYYLKEIKDSGGLHVYERAGKDVTEQIFDDDYIQDFHDWWGDYNPYFGNFMVYVDYTKAKKDNQFDWGLFQKNKWMFESIKEEFENGVNYEKFFSVEENDVVLDIGASVGPFTNSILHKNPKKVFALEPHPQLFQTLKNNFSQNQKVLCINKGISSIDGEVIFEGLFDDTKGSDYTGDDLWKKTEKCLGVSFKSLIEQNQIKTVDFLKIDCERGEYDVFTTDNLYWIENNVKKIAGEWHFHNDKLRQKFLVFRDVYLKKFKNFKLFFVDYHSNFFDVTNEVWNDDFVFKYGWINVYIDNRVNINQKKPKWSYAHFPTLEITTSIPKNGCVVDCVFCPQRTLQKKYEGERFLSFENYKKVIDKVPSEIRITFAGFTEPWLNKHCTDMVLYAHEKGHPISVFTTGIGMTIEDFERIRHIPFVSGPNGGFVLHVPDQERRAKHPITPKYIELLRHIQTTHFSGNPVQNYYWMAMGTPHESIQDFISTAPVHMMWSRAGNLLGEAMMKPELMNLKNHFGSIYHGDVNMTCGCEERLYHNILLPNGDVSLCCMDYNLDHILGNLFEQEYDEILPEPYSCFNLCRFCENAISPDHEIILKEKKEYNLV